MPHLLRSGIALLFVVCSLAHGGDQQVTLEKSADATMSIKIRDEPFALFNFGQEMSRPNYHPLTIDGDVITETRSSDHTHHTGVWIGVEHVNGFNYWGSPLMKQEDVGKEAQAGTIKNVAVEIIKGSGDPAKYRVVNHWLGEAGKPILEENTVVEVFGNGLMRFTIKLTAVNGPVEFEDTKEGFFAVRVAPTMQGRQGGTMIGDAGEVGESALWGKHHAWIDYYGPVDGKTYGVTLMDHPDNFRKSRYHVRGYGLFAISPFGEKAYTKGELEPQPVDLEEGKSLTLVYGLYAHAGDTKAAKVGDVYKQFRGE